MVSLYRELHRIPYREDDAEVIGQALGMVKGVYEVKDIRTSVGTNNSEIAILQWVLNG